MSKDLLYIGAVGLSAVIGLLLLSPLATTGQFYFAGNTIQYEPQEACDTITCEETGEAAIMVGITRPKEMLAAAPMIAMCSCPGEIQYVPLLQQYQPYWHIR